MLRFNLALYKKLIDRGMIYINWSATTATYGTRNFESPLIRLNCWSTFYEKMYTSYFADYPSGKYGNRSYQVPTTTVRLYGSDGTDSYGPDYTTSGKYDIKSAYDSAMGYNGLTDCMFTLNAYIYTSNGGDGYKGTHGRVFVRSFNCWFSKS